MRLKEMLSRRGVACFLFFVHVTPLTALVSTAAFCTPSPHWLERHSTRSCSFVRSQCRALPLRATISEAPWRKFSLIRQMLGGRKHYGDGQVSARACPEVKPGGERSRGVERVELPGSSGGTQKRRQAQRFALLRRWRCPQQFRKKVMKLASTAVCAALVSCHACGGIVSPPIAAASPSSSLSSQAVHCQVGITTAESFLATTTEAIVGDRSSVVPSPPHDATTSFFRPAVEATLERNAPPQYSAMIKRGGSGGGIGRVCVGNAVSNIRFDVQALRERVATWVVEIKEDADEGLAELRHEVSPLVGWRLVLMQHTLSSEHQSQLWRRGLFNHRSMKLRLFDMGDWLIYVF